MSISTETVLAIAWIIWTSISYFLWRYNLRKDTVFKWTNGARTLVTVASITPFVNVTSSLIAVFFWFANTEWAQKGS